MANDRSVQRDRDLDDGLLDLPAKDRQALRKLDTQETAPKKKPAKKRRVAKVAS